MDADGPRGAAVSRGDGLTATGRVPVEHRFFGLDRRSLLPGLVVIGLFVLWTVVLPGINSALHYSQTTKAGDVFQIAPGLTMDAEQGWGVESGLLTSDDTRGATSENVVLVNGAVSFSVTPGQFPGSLHTLLEQIDKVTSAQAGSEAFHVATKIKPFRTDAGARGLAQGYSTVGGVGAVVALVYGKTGLKISAAGPDAQMNDKADEIEKMVQSIRYDPKAAV